MTHLLAVLTVLAALAPLGAHAQTPGPWPGSCPSGTAPNSIGCSPQAVSPQPSDLTLTWQNSQKPHTRAMQLQQVVSSYGLGVSTAGCTSCAANGTTDDTAALQAFLTANAGATIWVPAGKKYLISSGNLVIPANTRLVGQGDSMGQMSAVPGYSPPPSAIILNPAYSVVVQNGTLEWLTIMRQGLTVNPTDSQVVSAVNLWGADNSVGVKICCAGTSSATVQGEQGARLLHLFIEGFNIGVFGQGGDYLVDDVAGDNYTMFYGWAAGDVNRVTNTRAEPFYCLQSTNCVGGSAGGRGRPGIAFFLQGAPVYFDNNFSEDYRQSVVVDLGIQNMSWVQGEYDVTQDTTGNSFGTAGLRVMGTSNPSHIRDLIMHWFGIEYDIEAGQFIDLMDSECSPQGHNASPEGANALGCVYLGGPSAASPTTITPGGSVTAGSTITATVTGTVLPPFPVPFPSSTAGGSLSATTYYVRTTYVTASGETTASRDMVQSVAANSLLVVNSPWQTVSAVTGWNVYVGTAAGSETKQNSSPIAIGTAWTEPTSGLTSGAAVPSSNASQFTHSVTYTAAANDTLASVGRYLQLRFDSDPIMTGEHINATNFNSTTGAVDIYPPLAMTATVTVSATGTLSASTSTGDPQVSGTSGDLLDFIPSYVGYGGESPLLIYMENQALHWDISMPKGSSTYLPSGWMSTDYLNGDSNGDQTSFYGYVSSLQSGANTSGTGCTQPSYGLSPDSHDGGGQMLVNTGATGCTVVYKTPWPFPPDCQVSAQSATAKAYIVPGSGTQFGFQFAFSSALSAPTYVTYSCAMRQQQ